MAPCTRDSIPAPTRRKTQFRMRMRPDGSAAAAGRLGGACLPDNGCTQLRAAARRLKGAAREFAFGGQQADQRRRRLIADCPRVRTLFGHEVDVLERYPIGLDGEAFARNDNPCPSALRADPLSRFQLQQLAANRPVAGQAKFFLLI